MARILIVGAGPAGMATALFLAKKGIKSTLIEKERFPREKICGDGLSGWVLYMLRKINPEWVHELAALAEARESHSMRCWAPNLKHVSLAHKNKYDPELASGYVIRRKDFDYFLWKKVLENPDIHTIEGLEIKKFYQDNGSARIAGIHNPDKNQKNSKEANAEEVELSGDLVVFCDGANSAFARSPGKIQKNDRHHATGLTMYYKGIAPVDEKMNPVEFFFEKSILPGYFWIFTLPNGEANVGLGIRTDILKKKKLQLKSLLSKCIEANPVLRERFIHAEPISEPKAWGLPLGSRKVPVSGDRFIIAGDAACLIDPFTGEGVGNALNSGSHAAEHIEQAILHNRFDAAFNRQYDTRIYNKLWKEFKNSSLIQKLLVKPHLFTFFINRAVNSHYLQKTLYKMIDSMEEREKIRNPFFYLRVLFSR